MGGRSTLYRGLGALFALLLILFATVLAAGDSFHLQAWMQAQLHTPLLWLVDFCAIYTCVLVTFFINYEGIARQTAIEMEEQRSDFQQRWDELTARNDALEKINSTGTARIHELELELREREAEFEREAHRLTEQAYQALEGQVEANTRQLDAVNMSMRYQRAELQSLRHTVRSLPLADSSQIAPEMLLSFSEQAPLSLNAAPDSIDPSSSKPEFANNTNDVEEDVCEALSSEELCALLPSRIDMEDDSCELSAPSACEEMREVKPAEEELEAGKHSAARPINFNFTPDSASTLRKETRPVLRGEPGAETTAFAAAVGQRPHSSWPEPVESVSTNPEKSESAASADAGNLEATIRMNALAVPAEAPQITAPEDPFAIEAIVIQPGANGKKKSTASGAAKRNPLAALISWRFRL